MNPMRASEGGAILSEGIFKIMACCAARNSGGSGEGECMTVHEFRNDNDEDDYLEWLARHADGYVINILSNGSSNGARVHRARCRTISGRIPRGRSWIGEYMKVCATSLSEIDQWSIERFGEPIVRCGICHPAGAPRRVTSTKRTEKAMTDEVSQGRFVIHGTAPDSAVVQAWAEDYIRFERRPPWQDRLRGEIRSRCQQLEPTAEQVFHATFFGSKLPNADVENLALYNIDRFRVAGRNGIRFEHGCAVPPAPDGAEYRFGYRYALARRTDSFAHWRRGRTLASFGWTDLGKFNSEKQLAQVWLALWRGEARTFFPAIEPDTRFGVRIEVRAPRGRQPVWGGLMKGIVDGVICAFQTHSDRPVSPEVLDRIAKATGAQPDEIERYLCDRSRAVLGVRRRLVSVYRSGVKFDPADHLCVAGELLAAEPVSDDDRWAIKGDIVELSR